MASIKLPCTGQKVGFGFIHLADCNQKFRIMFLESFGLQNLFNLISNYFIPLIMTDDIKKRLQCISGMIASEFLIQEFRSASFSELPCL